MMTDLETLAVIFTFQSKMSILEVSGCLIGQKAVSDSLFQR
jgi:hypothetical protein